MDEKISKEQYKNLRDARIFDENKFHKLLEEYTGILTKPCTVYEYYDAAGDYIGDSHNYTLDELLKSAYVEVDDNG